MSWVKKALASTFVRETVGLAGATYLRIVRATTRFVTEPRNPYADLGLDMPVIVAMWHGQHFMVPFVRGRSDRVVSLVSRSRDGELNAAVLRRLDVRAIRGSGARGRDPRRKGGAEALRQMLRALADGETVAMTADIPKISRVCGIGIVTLAQLSGRAIVPVAVVSGRRIDFESWDRASLGLPFSRGAMVFGHPIRVDRHLGPDDLEHARVAVEASLDAVHARAYGLIGAADPGAKGAAS